jgi:hypothetical protein
MAVGKNKKLGKKKKGGRKAYVPLPLAPVLLAPA